MKSHRRIFETSETQVAARRHDKYVLQLSSRQVNQRQDSRFNGLMKHNFGSSRCLQAYLQCGTFGPRMLPPLELEEMPPKSSESVDRYTNKRNPQRQAQSKRKYYENLVADLADPSSERAQKRQSKRFANLQKAMEDARKGLRYFYNPAPLPPRGRTRGRSQQASLQLAPRAPRGPRRRAKAKAATNRSSSTCTGVCCQRGWMSPMPCRRRRSTGGAKAPAAALGMPAVGRAARGTAGHGMAGGAARRKAGAAGNVGGDCDS